MDLELQAKLFRQYPKFFRKPGQRLVRTPDPLRVDMHLPEGLLSFDTSPEPPAEPEYRDDSGPIDARSIECADGWFSIIDCLAAAIEAEIDALVARGIGKEEWPRAHQIKEKFGGLRFYVAGRALLSAGLLAQIRQAERDSAVVCEQCGRPGELRRGSGWIHVACDPCEELIKQRGGHAEPWDGYEQRQAARQALLNARAE